MTRYDSIDVLKGIAVICMVIFHIFYFPNQYGFKEIKYDTNVLKIIAKIAQIIFIISVGINLYLSKISSNEKNETKSTFTKKSLLRILKIAFFAMLMSLFTWFVFGEKYVKFGILHFIALASLVFFQYSDNPRLVQSFFIIALMIYYLIINQPSIFKNIPDPISFVLGFYNKKYKAVDHFPIFPWILLIIIGMMIGNVFLNKKNTSSELIKDKILNVLKKIGKNSLEIYAIHWIVLYAIFCHIYPKYFRNV